MGNGIAEVRAGLLLWLGWEMPMGVVTGLQKHGRVAYVMVGHHSSDGGGVKNVLVDSLLNGLIPAHPAWLQVGDVLLHPTTGHTCKVLGFDYDNEGKIRVVFRDSWHLWEYLDIMMNWEFLNT